MWLVRVTDSGEHRCGAYRLLCTLCSHDTVYITALLHLNFLLGWPNFQPEPPPIIIIGSCPAIDLQFHRPTPRLPPPSLLRWATLTTNIAANIVGPANAFVNLSPGRVSFNGGALATALLGLVIMPWKLVRSWGVFEPTGK